MDDWVASRPPEIRALVAEFRPGLAVSVDGERHYVIGYNEGDMLIVSPINPCVDYDGALADKVYVCAAHFREEEDAHD